MKIKNKLIENFWAKVERLVEMRNKKNDDKMDPDSIPYENEINADDDFFIFSDDQSADFGSLFTNDSFIDEIFGE